MSLGVSSALETMAGDEDAGRCWFPLVAPHHGDAQGPSEMDLQRFGLVKGLKKKCGLPLLWGSKEHWGCSFFTGGPVKGSRLTHLCLFPR